MERIIVRPMQRSRSKTSFHRTGYKKVIRKSFLSNVLHALVIDGVGHVALPGGGRDPEDADDLQTAIRETREEIGLDLTKAGCLKVGNLPERVVTTTWGKEALMVLVPLHFRSDRRDNSSPATTANGDRSHPLDPSPSFTVTRHADSRSWLMCQVALRDKAAQSFATFCAWCWGK